MITRVPGATFLGRNPGDGICTRCNRDLSSVTYLIRIGGEEVVMGKRCAARTMGWATTRVEMEALSLLRVAEVQRRREVIWAKFPHLQAVWDDVSAAVAEKRAAGHSAESVVPSAAYNVLQIASTTDWMWGDDPSWVGYLESSLPVLSTPNT